MKDKEFSEQFQNLSKVWRYVVKSSKNDKYAKGNGFKQIAHTEKQIMKHCIDKQKLLDLFDKFEQEENDYACDDYPPFCIIADKIKKELGLDK